MVAMFVLGSLYLNERENYRIANGNWQRCQTTEATVQRIAMEPFPPTPIMCAAGHLCPIGPITCYSTGFCLVNE